MIDASAAVELLLQSVTGKRVARAINDDALLFAPDVINPEVAQSLRGLERAGRLTSARASHALSRLGEGAVTRVPTGSLMQDAWSLRHNLTIYDACYVVLARALDCPLLTLDGPLTRAPRLGVTLIAI